MNEPGDPQSISREHSQGKGPETGLGLNTWGHREDMPGGEFTRQGVGSWRTSWLRGQWGAMADFEQGRLLT